MATLTATFTPGANQPDVSIVSWTQDAAPTVCLALNAKEEVHEGRVFSCSRCVFSVVADRDVVAMADFQLRVVPARMYDATGPVDVHTCQNALPAIFGFAGGDLLKKHLEEGIIAHENFIKSLP